MKTFICVAMALFAAAALGGEARALTASHVRGAKAAVHAAAKPVADVSRRGRGGMFSNWCAYNCYLVPRCYNGQCLGRYGYSRFPYDEDLPFPNRYDWDASPIDNADAYVYRFTGAPVIRAFERIY
jgi:hypothetical protein